MERSISAIASVEGVNMVSVSSSVGGFAMSRRDSIAGAPAMMKPALKVRRVKARKMGARM
jgi:hypothetical protein